MTFSLPPELSDFVNQSVAAGKFASPDDMLIAGLRRLQAEERAADELKLKTREGIDALDRGDYTAVNSDAELENLFQEIRRRGTERVKSNS